MKAKRKKSAEQLVSSKLYQLADRQSNKWKQELLSADPVTAQRIGKKADVLFSTLLKKDPEVCAAFESDQNLIRSLVERAKFGTRTIVD